MSEYASISDAEQEKRLYVPAEIEEDCLVRAVEILEIIDTVDAYNDSSTAKDRAWVAMANIQLATELRIRRKS